MRGQWVTIKNYLRVGDLYRVEKAGFPSVTVRVLARDLRQDQPPRYFVSLEYVNGAKFISQAA
jgi:hypothetical protein